MRIQATISNAIAYQDGAPGEEEPWTMPVAIVEVECQSDDGERRLIVGRLFFAVDLQEIFNMDLFLMEIDDKRKVTQ